MTEHVEAKSPALADELLGIVQAVEGVSAVYPAQPLWQSIAGAAVAAVTGEQLPLISLAGEDGVVAVKARIGVGSLLPAPQVAREVAARSQIVQRCAIDHREAEADQHDHAADQEIVVISPGAGHSMLPARTNFLAVSIFLFTLG